MQRRPGTGRRGRGWAVKLLQELRQQRGGVEGLASLSGVRRQFNVDGYRHRRCFRLFGWLCRGLRGLLTLDVKAKKGRLAGAAVIDGVGRLVGAMVFFQQAEQNVAGPYRGLSRNLHRGLRAVQGADNRGEFLDDRFAPLRHGQAGEGAKPHADQQFQHGGDRRRGIKASAALQRFRLSAPQRPPQTGVCKRDASIQTAFFENAEEVVSETRLRNSAEKLHDAHATELQVRDLVRCHDLEPVEVVLPVGVTRRYGRQADSRAAGRARRIGGVDNLDVGAGEGQAVEVKDALHVLQIDLHGRAYSTTAPTISAMLCCNSASSVRLHTSATWQARRAGSPSFMRRAA